MNRITILLAVGVVGLLGACDTQTSLPEATGKGSVRAFNAIKTAPEVTFKIEERTLGAASYRQTTTVSPYDDLDYTFNFDVLFQGDGFLTRVASQFLDVEKDIDYVLVLTGAVSNASVLVWETVGRGFDGSETIFETRFAHTSASLGTVDYYFAAAGVAPVLGEQVGTLSFGDIVPGADYEAGEYVLTITADGDPGNILFQSNAGTFAAASQYIISTLDGDANTLAPFIARAIPVGINAGGVTVNLTDMNFPATVEFIHGSLDLGTVDIYEDDLLTSRVVAGQAYKDVSAEINLPATQATYFYTPADSTGAVLLEGTLNFSSGLRGRAITFGEAAAVVLNVYAPDRRSVETHAKLQLYNAVFNFAFTDIYIVEADTTIEGRFPILAGISRGIAAQTIPLQAGSYDIYVTESTVTDAASAPVRIDVARGDVVGGVIFDTVDPTVAELLLLPN